MVAPVSPGPESLWEFRPAAFAAVQRGCECDPLTNFWGNGVATMIDDQRAVLFEADPDCPVHGSPAPDAPKETP